MNIGKVMINPRKNDPLFEKFLHKRVEISSKNMEFGKKYIERDKAY